MKEVKDKDDGEAIKKATEVLSKAAEGVATKLYSQAAQPGGAPGQGPQPEDKKKDDEGPVEGEVVS